VVVLFQWAKGCKGWGGSRKSRGYLPDENEFERDSNGWPLDPETGLQLPIAD